MQEARSARWKRALKKKKMQEAMENQVQEAMESGRGSRASDASPRISPAHQSPAQSGPCHNLKGNLKRVKAHGVFFSWDASRRL